MESLQFPRLDICSVSWNHNRYCNFNPVWQQGKPEGSWVLCRRNGVAMKSVRAFHGGASGFYEKKKDSICTADELHYVSLPNSDWRLALWRYLPSLRAPSRNHPLLLLSGLGSNALGYDLSPESSFARYMSQQGYDTWTIEFRGSGLSTNRAEARENEQPFRQSLVKTDSFASSECSNISADKGQSSAVATQLRHWNQSLTDIIERAQLGPFQPFNLQGVSSALEDFREQLDLIVKDDWDFDLQPFNLQGVSSALEDFREQLDLIVKDDWDFDHYLEEDVPAAVDPVQAFNVPVFPIGPLMVVAHPLASRPPYVLSWLIGQISAEDMMHPTLLEKLAMNGFETVPAKVVVQLSTVFQEGGLCDRSGTFYYKNHLHQSNIPILALAGDKDLVCPPEAVYETVKLIPRQFVSYKVLGKPGGPHYAHYDIVGSRLAASQVYPLIIDFLNRHDIC